MHTRRRRMGCDPAPVRRSGPGRWPVCESPPAVGTDKSRADPPTAANSDDASQLAEDRAQQIDVASMQTGNADTARQNDAQLGAEALLGLGDAGETGDALGS